MSLYEKNLNILTTCKKYDRLSYYGNMLDIDSRYLNYYRQTYNLNKVILILSTSYYNIMNIIYLTKDGELKKKYLNLIEKSLYSIETFLKYDSTSYTEHEKIKINIIYQQFLNSFTKYKNQLEIKKSLESNNVIRPIEIKRNLDDVSIKISDQTPDNNNDNKKSRLNRLKSFFYNIYNSLKKNLKYVVNLIF